MPAEIDTGGPRVLHCDQRADCPTILNSPAPTLVLARSAAIQVQQQQRKQRQYQQRRLGVRTVDRFTEDSALLDSYNSELRVPPGNDERDEFFRDERSASPIATTSSNDLGRLGGARDRRDRKRCGAAESLLPLQDRRRIARRHSLRCSEMAKSSVWLRNKHQDVPKVNENTREASWTVDETREMSSAIPEENSGSLDSSTTSTCDLNRQATSDDRQDHRDGPEVSSAIAMRLFGDGSGGGGCDVERNSVLPRIGKSATAISSQRSRPSPEESKTPAPVRVDANKRRDYCVEYAWRCKCECGRECECFTGDPSDHFRRSEQISEKSTWRRINREEYIERRSSRSYLRVALLLFLVAFGHSGVLKSNFNSGIHRFLTIGAIVGAVQALPVDLDAGVRAERSANLSHITGASRKIQMYIKNRHLQILPDGTVNGSNDDTSEYTIFQRTSVSRGQLRIQGVATCLYLCMDSCGLLYGSREYTEDCVFNETLEQHNYNTYSSVRWSTARKTLYLGLNRRGQPRRVQAKGHNLGRLSAYARVLTQVAPPDRVEALQARMLGAQHNLRHHHNSHHHRNMQQAVCPNVPPQEKDGRDKFRCRKRKKRKKRKRRCNEGEKPGPHCEIVVEDQQQQQQQQHIIVSHRGNPESNGGEGPPQSKRSCEGAASEELCRKQALDAPAKKRKSRIESEKTNGGAPANGKQQQQQKKKQQQQQQQQQQNQNQNRQEVKPKKIAAVNGAKKPNSTIVSDNEPLRRPKGSNGKKKRPLSKQRTSMASRRKVNVRATRTTLAANSSSMAITLPSTWYPGASTTPSTKTTISNKVNSVGPTIKCQASPRNAVTSIALKDNDSQSSRNGKSLEIARTVSELATVEISSTEATEDHSGFSSINDLSVETSEEAKSEELISDDDSTTTSSLEYSTLMTTMDTTPPERTEDYTRATTQSIFFSPEINRTQADDANIENFTSIERSDKFDHEYRASSRRLAM